MNVGEIWERKDGVGTRIKLEDHAGGDWWYASILYKDGLVSPTTKISGLDVYKDFRRVSA